MGMHAGANKRRLKGCIHHLVRGYQWRFGRSGAAGMMRSSTENICSFYKERKCARKRFIVFATLSNLKKTSNIAVNHTSYKMHENLFFYYFYCKSDMHVRPIRFCILCTPTDSSDKTELMYSWIVFIDFKRNCHPHILQKNFAHKRINYLYVKETISTSEHRAPTY